MVFGSWFFWPLPVFSFIDKDLCFFVFHFLTAKSQGLFLQIRICIERQELFEILVYNQVVKQLRCFF